MVGKTAKGAMMGRQPLSMKEYKVQLDPKVVERVDVLVGTYRRSGFIRDAMAAALERELERREKG